MSNHNSLSTTSENANDIVLPLVEAQSKTPEPLSLKPNSLNFLLNSKESQATEAEQAEPELAERPPVYQTAPIHVGEVIAHAMSNERTAAAPAEAAEAQDPDISEAEFERHHEVMDAAGPAIANEEYHPPTPVHASTSQAVSQQLTSQPYLEQSIANETDTTPKNQVYVHPIRSGVITGIGLSLVIGMIYLMTR